MEFIVGAAVQKNDCKLRRLIDRFFPPPKIKQGIARVEAVEEVLVKENIFHSKQLVLCEDIPPQIDHYLVTLVFDEQHYRIKCHQMYAVRKEVAIQYTQRLGRIQILKICKICRNY